MPQTIYKVVDKDLWQSAKSTGQFSGAPIDIQDGYIHFSSAKQVVETVTKHFAGVDNLVLLSIDESELGNNLKWEASRNNDLFPHLYGVLNTSHVHLEEDLPIGPDGTHQFPERLR